MDRLLGDFYSKNMVVNPKFPCRIVGFTDELLDCGLQEGASVPIDWQVPSKEVSTS